MNNKKKVKEGRDYTKYSFQGKMYGKGQLVLAVIKHHITLNPTMTIKELKLLFPRKMFNVPFDVVETVRKADTGRFFLNPADRISTANGKAVVTNQWSKNTIVPFIAFVEKKLGFSIQRKQHKMAA